MNRLQNLDRRHPLFVTLNPNQSIAPDQVLRSFTYDHPLFDKAALKAQQQLWQLNANRNTWFCGSYFGYGFHEDALQSGLAVAEALSGVARPWQVARQSERIARRPAVETVL
jgi:predicted NAD/FAD-binding protein